jgi:NADH dehydrogenase FAD-containing subunit
MNPERIVIVGGGFAGVAVAQNAERHLKSSLDIVVISRENHLVFSPLLPEVAARGISFMHVAVPGRTITRRTRWMQADVTGIDSKLHTVSYSVSEDVTAEIEYTDLVLACGSETNLDTIPGLRAHSFPIKTAIEAIMLGNEVIARFEQAAVEQDDEKRRELLTIVFIGGGFSGVEIAGQLNDLMDEIHPSHPELGAVCPKVIILQGGDKVLPELSHGSLSDFTYRKLVKNGVDVRLKTRVAEVTERGVLLDSGTIVAGGMVVCTIGTAPNRLNWRKGPHHRADRNHRSGARRSEPVREIRHRRRLWQDQPSGARGHSSAKTRTLKLQVTMPQADPDSQWKPKVNPWIIASTVALAAFMEVLDSSIANVALPHISGSLGASTDEGTWVLTSYLVSNAIVLPMGAWASSVIGRKNFFMACIVIFTATSFLCGIAPSLPILLLARVLQGAGGGGLQPMAQAIMADSFEEKKRGQAFALYGLVAVLAPSIGPTIGGWVTDSYSWRWIFYLNIPVGILALVLVSRLVEDPPWIKADRSNLGRLDYVGVGFLGIAMAGMQIMLDKGEEDNWFASNLVLCAAYSS